jgi:hypothetical protein
MTRDNKSTSCNMQFPNGTSKIEAAEASRLRCFCHGYLTHTARSLPQSRGRALQSGGLLRPVHHGVRSSRRRGRSAVEVAAYGSSCLQPLAAVKAKKLIIYARYRIFSRQVTVIAKWIETGRKRYDRNALLGLGNARPLRSQCVKLRLAMYDKLLGQPLSNE